MGKKSGAQPSAVSTSQKETCLLHSSPPNTGSKNLIPWSLSLPSRLAEVSDSTLRGN